ncbi:ATP-binding protein [Proteobacteria bacterium 005FR1]|nr:ATP-binding protein [Proteobacteria bacterium 005FR1]
MEAVLFIGIQGSGKSTFYQQQFFETHLRINLDMLKTRHRETLLVEACIQARQRFVVDNTNVRREDRQRYIPQLRAAGFRIIGYFFEPVPERALRWNDQRSGKARIPVKGVLGTLKRLERPERHEGFDELFRLVVGSEGEFLPEPM